MRPMFRGMMRYGARLGDGFRKSRAGRGRALPKAGRTETRMVPAVRVERAPEPDHTGRFRDVRIWHAPRTEAGGTAIADIAIDTPRHADRGRGGSGSRFVGEAAAALFSLTSTWPPALVRLFAADLRGAIMRICEVRLEHDGIVTTVPLDPDRARSIL